MSHDRSVSDALARESKRPKAGTTKDRRRLVHEFCHEFAASGTCRFGADCRFNHDYDSFLGKHAEFFRNIKILKDNAPGDTETKAKPFEYPHPPFHQTYEVPSKVGDDWSLIIHAHNNGILAFCLSKAHPAFVTDEEIRSIEFKPQKSHDVRDEIAVLTSKSGQTYRICTPLPGIVLEFNEMVKDDPMILKRDNVFRGYFVLFKPKSPFHLFLPKYFKLLASTVEYGDDERQSEH